jgi:hypothetical protein
MHNIRLPHVISTLINRDVENGATLTQQSRGVQFIIVYKYALVRVLITVYKLLVISPYDKSPLSSLSSKRIGEDLIVKSPCQIRLDV